MSYGDYLANVKLILDRQAYPYNAWHLETYANWCWWRLAKPTPRKVADLFRDSVQRSQR